MKLHLKKLHNGTLMPDDAQTVEALAAIKVGAALHGEFKRERNAKFHRKWFLLVEYAFDVWEPGQGLPEKNFERFRKDVIIAAGYYDLVPAINGELRAEAKSISFGSMDDLEFSKLYEATITALLKFVLKNYTREDIDRVQDRILEFA